MKLFSQKLGNSVSKLQDSEYLCLGDRKLGLGQGRSTLGSFNSIDSIEVLKVDGAFVDICLLLSSLTFRYVG